jgi:hypothetical protein
LNTETNSCETIKLLTFSPRCLVAQNGWVCCGGETGEFTAIRLDEENDDNDFDTRLDSMDTAPFGNDDFGSPHRSIFPGIDRARRSNKSLIAKSMKLATDRVNCITLWFPPESGPFGEGSYTEPVAVLANNDRTVTIVSLRDFDANEKTEPLEVVKYPDFVNRAIISPDGRLLVAILDDPFLYVHQRAEKHPEDLRSLRTRENAEYHWQQCGKMLLKSQRRDDGSDSRGSFAACFNHSGAYLAVGTQYGTISIFDTKAFANPTLDPLITSFKSSRPEEGPGAVRDMAFSPGPWDLLAWTEDKGHIGVADLRSNFISRQVLDITDEGGFEHISILDKNTIDPRLLEGRSERAEGLNSTLSSELSISMENRRRRGVDGPERGTLPLTAEETLVLDALQAESRRREQRISAQRLAEGVYEVSVPSPWADRTARRQPTQPETDNRTSRERSSSVSRAAGTAGATNRERSSSVTRAIGDLLGNIRDQRERAQERVRSAQLLLREAQDRERQNREGRRTLPPPRRVPGPPQRVPSGGARTTAMAASPGSSAWSDLEALYNLSFESTLYDSTRNDVEPSRRNADQPSLLPLLNQVYPRDWEEVSNIRRHAGVHESPPQPDNTAGLSWSEDGRIL